MILKVERITPEIATDYLKRNTNNYRKMSRSKIFQYARDMKKGQWQLNGQPIVFDANGTLKDGQHRLSAVIVAKTPVDMAVAYGVDANVNIFDVGVMRTAEQITRASGIDLDRIAVSAANQFVCRLNDRDTTKADTVKYISEHWAELARAYRVSGATTSGADTTKRHGKKMSIVLSTYLALRLNLMPEYEVSVFFRVFNYANTIGADGYEPSPALVARRMFDDRFQAAYSGRGASKEQMEILMLALDDFHKHKSRQLNYRLIEPFKSLELIDKLRKEDGLE